jgi:hypothetical protein
MNLRIETRKRLLKFWQLYTRLNLTPIEELSTTSEISLAYDLPPG